MHYFRGNSLNILQKLIKTENVNEIFCNQLNEPALIERDKKVKLSLANEGINLEISFDRTLIDVKTIYTKSDTPFRVFTPFFKQWQKRLYQQDINVLPVPKITSCKKSIDDSLVLNEMGLLDEHCWHDKLKKHWQAGEDAGLALSANFINEKLNEYSVLRDFPEHATSRVSPYLQLGAITPRQILAQLNYYGVALDNKDAEHFLREIAWRDFSNHIMLHYPHTTNKPLNYRYENFKWKNDNTAQRILLAWQKGKTNIPLIDAGMRELWETGFMHNRIRMVVASLLCKNGLVNWCEGARWFWDTLLDADLASNSFNWQWVAGCGADAAPYFRIFNPVSQSKKFDPNGHYIRRWVPEVAALSNKEIHAPFEVKKTQLSLLPSTAPLDCLAAEPIVDLKLSRLNALEHFKRERSNE